YHRVPITDEQAPLPHGVDQLVSMFECEPWEAIWVFNCQMGRGRTTTGMILHVLWKIRVGLAKPPPVATKSEAKESNEMTDAERETLVWKRGEYPAVLDLMRLLEEAKKAKQLVDEIIDFVSAMQNLREAIFQLKTRTETSISEKARAHNMHRLVHYLRRYCLLIAFSGYLLTAYEVPKNREAAIQRREKSPASNNTGKTKEYKWSFTKWLEQRRDVLNLIAKATIELKK
ncbi:hypothetical protein RFI_00829, partial [Reticulomyxa filosa]